MTYGAALGATARGTQWLKAEKWWFPKIGAQIIHRGFPIDGLLWEKYMKYTENMDGVSYYFPL